MKENLLSTIDAYMNDSFNDGVDKGRELYQRDALSSLTNFLHELLAEGKPNQAEAVAEAMKRIEKLK